MDDALLEKPIAGNPLKKFLSRISFDEWRRWLQEIICVRTEENAEMSEEGRGDDDEQWEEEYEEE